jgi:hypothetical protein
MSSPSFTSFCKNGHIVESIPEGCLSFKDLTECSLCHSTETYTILSWRDRDPETCVVPQDPIQYEWIKVWDENIHGQIRVPVYDVSKIKKGWINHKIIEV